MWVWLSDAPFYITVMSGFVSMLCAIFGVYVAVRNLHKLINSRLDELIALTAQTSRAEGFAAGQAESRTQTGD